MYRTNAQSRAIEERFVSDGLPYRVVGGTRFYERREIRDALAYLRVVPNPIDTVSLRRILNTRAAGSVTAPRPAWRHSPRASGCPSPRRCGAATGRRDGGPQRQGGAGFADLMDEMRELSQSGMPPAEVLEAVLDRAATSRSSRLHDPQDESRVENLAELVGVARSSASGCPTAVSAGEFMEQVVLAPKPEQSLVADADDPGPDGDGDGVVTLMTLHAAKGLEYPVVFLTGLEDGVFPHLRTLGDRRSCRRSVAWRTSGSPAPASGCTSPAPTCAAPGGRRVQPAVAVPRRGARRAPRLAPARVRLPPRRSSQPAVATLAARVRSPGSRAIPQLRRATG